MIRSTIIIISFFISINTSKAQATEIKAYVEQYAALAITEQQRTGIPAAITLAQGIHESGAGKGVLAAQSNNHFGIKCKSNWTGPTVRHNDDAQGECFRAYASVADSYIDHSNFLKTSSRYAALFSLQPLDYQGWAYGLKQAGYATNPRYPQVLIQLIENYQLNNYTLSGLNNATTDPIPSNSLAIDNMKQNQLITPMPSKNSIQKSAEETSLTNNSKTNVTILPDALPDHPFYIAQTKAIVVQEGTSLLAIANRFSIKLFVLQSINGLKDQLLAPATMLLFLERKKTQEVPTFHTVQTDERLWLIAQAYQVSLPALKALNAVSENEPLRPGQNIRLK